MSASSETQMFLVRGVLGGRTIGSVRRPYRPTPKATPKPAPTTKFEGVDLVPLSRDEEREFNALLVQCANGQPTFAKKGWLRGMASLREQSPRGALRVLRGMK